MLSAGTPCARPGRPRCWEGPVLDRPHQIWPRAPENVHGSQNYYLLKNTPPPQKKKKKEINRIIRKMKENNPYIPLTRENLFVCFLARGRRGYPKP